jgi:DNA-binding response OmpR family regulator
MGKAGFSRAPEPRRLLVVEDQESLSTVIAEGLAPSFEVLCSATVADGVELLLAAAVDVVLLDCVLPGETMWQIVLEADRQQVPVVLMTGDPARMKEARAEARPYILKPFTLTDLKRVLEDVAPGPASGDTPAFVGRPQAKAGGLRLSAQGTAKANEQ